jgi:hypothetical protein
MEERLFLDWIDVLGAYFPINKAVQCSGAVFPHSADAPVAVGNQAVKPAQAATDTTIVFPCIKQSFLHGTSPLFAALNYNSCVVAVNKAWQRFVSNVDR